MLKKLITISLTIFLALCLSSVYAATPKTPEYSADKAVLGYAELYAFGKSENLFATGLPDDLSKKISDLIPNHLMLSFKNYPLNEENFSKVQARLIEKLGNEIKISAQLKVDDAENPVVELTANHIDQAAVDELKQQDGNFITLDVMKHISTPQELAYDGEFQRIATASLLGTVDGLKMTDATTLEVTCKIIETEDGKFFWMPQDIESLRRFVDPIFTLRETDPMAIDALLATIFSNGGTPEDEINSEGNDESNAEKTAAGE